MATIFDDRLEDSYKVTEKPSTRQPSLTELK